MTIPTSTERAFPAPRRLPESAPVYALEALPILGDEHLILAVQNLNVTTDAQLTVIGRMWSDDDRTVKPFSQTFTIAANGSGSNRLALERGALLTLRVQCDTSIGPNQVYCRLSLIKGFAGAIQAIGTVLQGYVGFDSNLAWPGSPVVSSLSGPGAVRDITWTQATATILTATVPANRRWRVVAGMTQPQTSAVAAVRVPLVTVIRGGVSVWISATLIVLNANQGQNTPLAPGIYQSVAPVGAGLFFPFPTDLELRAGDIVRVELVNAQVGDTYTGNALMVREWYDPA